MDNIKAVIFDIDGTLVNSMGVWSESDRIFLERRNIPYDPTVSNALKSMHFLSASEYLKNFYRLPEGADEIAAEITEIVREKYFHEIELMPFVNELIDNFKRRGIRMCAATSNSRELAEGVLRHNHIFDDLEFLITSDEAGSGKENPTIFKICSERLNVSPNQTAVFEDSPHAAKTAYENGYYTVGVNSGYFNDFTALEGCTTIRINSFEELLK